MENVIRARQIVDELLPLVAQAKKSFKGARNWSIVDVLGGGFITDLIKHAHLARARDNMEEINYKMRELQVVLGQINMPGNDYRMESSGFLTFGDFFFDGAFMDIWMSSKIWSSLNEVEKLEQRLLDLRSRLG